MNTNTNHINGKAAILRKSDFIIPDSAAIIQPYVFPYIGYFQLLYSADKVVFYDDVNFIKRGWINRNRILLNNTDYRFTIPLKKASQNKTINQVEPLLDEFCRKKLNQQFRAAYSKAPYYKEISALMDDVYQYHCNDIGELAIYSILAVCNYLEIDIEWMKSSERFKDSKGKERADRLIWITKQLACSTYINPIGGKDLYCKNYFKAQDINLQFLRTGEIVYPQFKNQFIPNLSIIDVLMFNDKQTVLNFLKEYSIV